MLWLLVVVVVTDYYGFISCRRTVDSGALVCTQQISMKHHFLRRKRTLIILICISFVLAILMGIKLHIDLGRSFENVQEEDSIAVALPLHFIKSSLDEYAEGHPTPKTLQEFGHNVLIDKGKMMHKHVKNKIVEKLSDIGFLKVHGDDEHLLKGETPGGQKRANDGIKHEMKKREISGKTMITDLFLDDP